MPTQLNVQREVELAGIPDDETLQAWASAAHMDPATHIEINLRIVSKAEIQSINRTYRGQNKATNVLSFASSVPPGAPLDILGDLIICAEIVANEAAEYGKSLAARWAHMLVHGCLHIQGFMHESEQEQEFMETAEIRILKELGMHNPYQVD